MSLMELLLRLLEPAFGGIAALILRNLLALGLWLVPRPGDDEDRNAEQQQRSNQRHKGQGRKRKARSFGLGARPLLTRPAGRAPPRQRRDIIVDAGPAVPGSRARQPPVVHRLRTGLRKDLLQGYLASRSGTLSSAKVLLPQLTSTVSTSALAGIAKLTSHQSSP